MVKEYIRLRDQITGHWLGYEFDCLEYGNKSTGIECIRGVIDGEDILRVRIGRFERDPAQRLRH